MKGKTAHVNRKLFLAAAIGGLAAISLPTHATDFIWTGTANNGNWNDPLNWNLNSGFPDATSATATFANQSAGTIGLNGDRTVGSLAFTNATGSFLLAAPSNTLTLDNGAAGATLNQTGGGTNTIATRLSAAGLTANITGGHLILSNVGDGASANALAGTITVGTGAVLEGNFTATSNALGSTAISLAGGTLQLQNAGPAGTVGALGNNLTIADNSTIATGGPASSVNLGALLITRGKTLAIGSGATVSVLSTAFVPPIPQTLDPSRTFTFDIAAGSTLSLGQINDSATSINGDFFTKTGDGKLVIAPLLNGSQNVGLNVGQGEVVLQSELGHNSLQNNINLNGAQNKLTFQVLSGSTSFGLGKIAVADNATISEIFNGVADGLTPRVTIGGNIPVTVAGKTLTFDIGADVMVINGFISGTNITLSKVGNGTLDLNRPNTYSGTTAIGSGSGFLRLSNPTALGSSSLLVGAGQMLDVNAALTGTGAITIAPGAIVRLSQPQALGGTQFTPASIPAGANIQLVGVTPSLDQVNPAVFYTVLTSSVNGLPMNLSHDPNFPLSGTLTNGDLDVTFSTPISAGNGVVLASTTGRNILFTKAINAGNNTPLTIGSTTQIGGLEKNGTVRINSSSIASEVDVVSGSFFGVLGNDAPIVVKPGATDIFAGGNSTVFLQGGSALANATPGAGGLAGNGNVTIVLTSTNSIPNVSIGSNNVNTRFAGSIGQDAGTNQATLRKMGTGLIELTGQSTYLGLTTLDAGTVLVSGSGRISLGDVGFVSGILRIQSLSAIAPGKNVGGGVLGLDAMIDPTSIVSGNGVVAINVDNYTIPLDQSAIGNGMASLGSQLPSTVSVLTGATTTDTAIVNLPGNGTYAATSLGVGKTLLPAVSAGAYRLGGGGGRLTIANSVLVGDATLTVDKSPVSLLAPNTYFKGTTVFSTLFVNNGTNGSATGNGLVSVGAGVLGGNGTIASNLPGKVVSIGDRGSLSPGDGGPGTLYIKTSSPTPDVGANSTLVLSFTSFFTVDVDPRHTSDLVNLTGTVYVGGAQLSATLLSTPQFGDVIPLLINDGTDPIGFTFANLPEGAPVNLTFNGQSYQFDLTYLANFDGGSVGNDIALTSVPEPASLGCIALAASILASRRRRK